MRVTSNGPLGRLLLRCASTRSSSWCCSSVLALLSVSACAKQDVVDLPPPVSIAQWSAGVDTLAGTYTRVVMMAEFHDTMAIVPDMADNVVWRVNVSRGTREPFGSRGRGPGEYQQAGWAVKVHADSVALLWGTAVNPLPVLSVMTSQGRTQASLTTISGDPRSAAFATMATPFLRLADTLGRVYGAAVMRLSGGAQAPIGSVILDTQPVIRMDLRAPVTDTMLRVFVGVAHVPVGRDVDGASINAMGLGPYGPYNDWHAFADGRMIHVDAAQYRMVVTDHTGTVLEDFTVPFPAIPVSESGWSAYVQATTNNSIALINKSAAQLEARMGAPVRGFKAPRYSVPDRPATLPPVSTGGGIRRMHGYDQMVWVPVSRVDPPGTEYWDEIDLATRTRRVTVAMPPNHRLVHVTARGAYVVAKDDDDLERILLYRTPHP